jgi:hypothetical protein
MNVRARGTDFIYDVDGNVTEANVRFDSVNDDGSNIGGFIKITADEYSANSSIPALSALVFAKVKEKFNA